jgi:hypothetical protein
MRAINPKLGELIQAIDNAKNQMMDLEKLSDNRPDECFETSVNEWGAIFRSRVESCCLTKIYFPSASRGGGMSRFFSHSMVTP